MNKEIDFDELDKAVSSTIDAQSNAKPKPAMNESAKSLTPAAPLSASAEHPANDQPEPASSKEPHGPLPTIPVSRAAHSSRPIHLNARPPRLPLTQSSRGAIDIIAPKPTSPRVASRIAATISPVTSSDELRAVAAETPPKEPVAHADEPAVTPVATEEAQPAEPTEKKSAPSPAEKWPDPLDFHSSEEDMPSDSPFLPGAKVAKRPLGAYAEQSPLEPELKTEEEPAQPVAADEPAPKQEVEPEKTAPESEPKISEPEAHPAPAAVSPASEIREHAMLSIPQQYRAANKTVDTKTRPVFDVNEYHPPLLEQTAHGAHKNAIWVRLFIALLILAILAIGGYFVYLYSVQHFD